MADNRRKVVKDGWGSRANFQASYGLRMTPEDLAVGDEILNAKQRVDARGSEENDVDKEAEGEWVKRNRGRYGAGWRSELKEAVAQPLAEEYKFTPSGDPEIDLMAAMGLRDMKSDPQSSHMFESGESSLSNLGGSAAEVGAKKSKRQLRRERQRESARKRNQEINLAAISSSPPPATPHPLSAQHPEAESRQVAGKNFDDVCGATQKPVDTLGKISRLAPGVARDMLLDWGNDGIGNIANKVRGELEEQGFTEESGLDWSEFAYVTRRNLEIVDGLLALPELAGVTPQKLLATITNRPRSAEPVKPWPAWLPEDFTKEEFLELTEHVCPAPSVSTGPGISTCDDLPFFSGDLSEFAAWSSQVNLLFSIETGHTATSVAAIVLGKLTGTAARRAAGFHLHHPKLWEEMMSNQMPPVIALTSLLHHISKMCSDVAGANALFSTPGPTSPDPSRTLIACELLGITTLDRCQRILCCCNRPLRIGKDSLPPQFVSSSPGTRINYCFLGETDVSKCEKILCGCKRPLRMACGCNWDHPEGDCPYTM